MFWRKLKSSEKLVTKETQIMAVLRTTTVRTATATTDDSDDDQEATSMQQQVCFCLIF